MSFFSPLSAAELTTILLSLKVASVATLVGLPFGILFAWLLSRVEFRGKIVLDILIHLPLVLPPVVTGYVLLLMLGRKGVVGQFLDEAFGLVFAFRWTGAVIAAAIMAFPLMVRSIRLSMDAMHVDYTEMAVVMGASRWQILRYVTVPLALPGILAGSILAFAKALGEFGATITFVSNIPGETQTIPAAIFSALQSPGGDIAAFRLSLVAVVIAIVAVAASEWLARRTRERMM